MRFQFIDANYPAFLETVYREEPGLAEQPYAAQIARIRKGLFGEAQFQAEALIDLGHEAAVIITNAHAAQGSWAKEHGLGALSVSRLQFSPKGGLIPWWTRPARETNWEIVLAQVRAYRPDVLYVEIMDTLPIPVAKRLRELAPFTVAQAATTLPATSYQNYDLILSSIPALVDGFREAGLRSEWMPLAFEPRVLEIVGVRERDIAVSFVGSFSNAYADRETVVDAVARATGVDTWTEVDSLSINSPIRDTVRGSAFGRDMYEVLARSRMTLNSHGTVAAGDSNNLRLYEATGMGTLLVTDAGRNLRELFDVGREVVTYSNASEAAEIVQHYVNRPDEAAGIARAGQARTLREHTWRNRADQMLDLIKPRR